MFLIRRIQGHDWLHELATYRHSRVWVFAPRNGEGDRLKVPGGIAAIAVSAEVACALLDTVEGNAGALL